MSDQDERGFGDRMIDAYHRMLERVKHFIEEAEKGAGPTVEHAIENAKETATELNELTREEADRIGDYIRRDLEEAATFVTRTGRELGAWLRFDLEAVERGLADIFSHAVDQTRVELEEFSRRADAMGEWHTGEITAMGTLQCKSCGELVHFQRIGRIPPCPKCHGTRFRRITEEDQD